MSLSSFNLIGQQTIELLQGLCFLTFQGLSFQTSKCWEIQEWIPWQPSFYISKMSIEINNVSTKFQFDWPANNRIIEGLLFSHFSWSLFSDFKMLGNTAVEQWQPSFYISRMSRDLNNVSTKFQLNWPAKNRIIEGSLFSHFSGSLFSDFSKCWEIQQWMRWQPSFYISNMSLDINNVSTIFPLGWPANNRIIAGYFFLHVLFRVFGFRLFKMLGNTAVDAMATKFRHF